VLVISVFLYSAGILDGRIFFVPNLKGKWDSVPFPRVFLIFFIELDDFMCPNCLDIFLDVIQAFPGPFLESNAFGIIAGPKRENGDPVDLSLAILEKKLRGFSAANDIPFSLWIDRDGLFESLERRGTSIVILDGRNQNVLRFEPPLSPIQVKMIDEMVSCDSSDPGTGRK